MREILVVMALIPSMALAGEAPESFAAHFVDRTMRVDFYHVGNASEEIITLDRVYEQGAWPGSRVHLLDPFDNGRYAVKVYDLAGGELLFSRGYDCYFGEYRTTAAAQKGARRTYHESALFPFPKRTVRVVIETRGTDRAMAELASFEIDPASWEILRRGADPGAQVFNQWISGDPHGTVDVAILGDGYTTAQAGKFKADLERFTGILLAAEPYASFKNRFNVYGVLKPSQDSGIDEPSHGAYRRSAVGATFDSLGSERYVLTEDNRALRDIAAAVPYDAIYVMVNSPRYGGGGIYNLYATFTTDNQWHAYVFLHELGHSFGGLADEYYTSLVAYNEFYPPGVEPGEPNITALLDPGKLKWHALVTPGTSVPTPWEKAEFDTMDMAYQKVRQEINQRLATLKREGAPAEEIATLEEESERRSREHAKRMDAYLAASAFVGQVGAFEGAGYAAQGLYRPTLDCLMFSKGAKPLCPVCRAAVQRRIAHFTE